jgi:hypothetical protein
VSPEILACLREWAEQRNGIASLWLLGSQSNEIPRDAIYEFAVELRPTRGRNDWALAEYVAYCDAWKADLARITHASVHLVAFRDDSNRPRDLEGTALLIWVRTKVIAEVK